MSIRASQTDCKTHPNRNVWYILIPLAVALAWGMAGCCKEVQPPSNLATKGDVDFLSKQIESLKQPESAAPIDYTARFDAIDKALARPEHSVIVPPAKPPEPVKKRVCR